MSGENLEPTKRRWFPLTVSIINKERVTLLCSLLLSRHTVSLVA